MSRCFNIFGTVDMVAVTVVICPSFIDEFAYARTKFFFYFVFNFNIFHRNYEFKWIDGVKWTGAKYIKGMIATVAAAAAVATMTSIASTSRLPSFIQLYVGLHQQTAQSK